MSKRVHSVNSVDSEREVFYDAVEDQPVTSTHPRINTPLIPTASATNQSRLDWISNFFSKVLAPITQFFSSISRWLGEKIAAYRLAKKEKATHALPTVQDTFRKDAIVIKGDWTLVNQAMFGYKQGRTNGFSSADSSGFIRGLEYNQYKGRKSPPRTVVISEKCILGDRWTKKVRGSYYVPSESYDQRDALFQLINSYAETLYLPAELLTHTFKGPNGEVVYSIKNALLTPRHDYDQYGNRTLKIRSLIITHTNGTLTDEQCDITKAIKDYTSTFPWEVGIAMREEGSKGLKPIPGFEEHFDDPESASQRRVVGASESDPSIQQDNSRAVIFKGDWSWPNRDWFIMGKVIQTTNGHGFETEADMWGYANCVNMVKEPIRKHFRKYSNSTIEISDDCFFNRAWEKSAVAWTSGGRCITADHKAFLFDEIARHAETLYLPAKFLTYKFYGASSATPASKIFYAEIMVVDGMNRYMLQTPLKHLIITHVDGNLTTDERTALRALVVDRTRRKMPIDIKMQRSGSHVKERIPALDALLAENQKACSEAEEKAAAQEAPKYDKPQGASQAARQAGGPQYSNYKGRNDTEVVFEGEGTKPTPNYGTTNPASTATAKCW